MALILQPVTLLLMLKPLDASNPYQHNYEVEEIVSIRASDGKYKMKWKRYDSSQNAFDLKRHICCIGMVQSFHWINNLAPPTLRSLVSTRPHLLPLSAVPPPLLYLCSFLRYRCVSIHFLGMRPLRHEGF